MKIPILSKIKTIFKKYGFIGAIKKILKYIYCNIFHPLILKIKTFINKKKYTNILNNILNSSYDRIIIWRSSFGWNVPLFQRPQHIANNLADNNCLVFYEVTQMTDNVDNIKKVKDNLYLINYKNSTFINILEKLIDNKHTSKYLQFYSTDWVMSVDYIKSYINRGFKLLYEYIDDINPSLSGTKELPINIKEKYEYMLKDTENTFVVVTADELEKDVLSKRGKEKLAFSCNGVDYKHFSTVDKEFSLDNKFLNIIENKKPIIGYYGALASWFDYDLIKYLASKRPDYNIVLFGIKYDDSFDKANLNKYSNIYFLGPKDYNILPNFASKFTVCTIPFVINSITEATSPLKLFEYMALGKPIVTTDMNECRKYKSVMISKTQDEFVELIDKAINLNPTNDNNYFNTLKQEALENTWEEKAKIIINLLKKYE